MMLYLTSVLENLAVSIFNAKALKSGLALLFIVLVHEAVDNSHYERWMFGRQESRPEHKIISGPIFSICFVKVVLQQMAEAVRKILSR
jgi:hypothetical protein